MGIFDKFKKQTPPAASNPAPQQQPDKQPAEPKAPEQKPLEPAKSVSVFGRLKQGLIKTKQLLLTDVRDLFKKEGRLVDEAFLEELRAALIKTDMGPAAAEQIVAQIGTDFRARVIQMAEALDIIRRQLKTLMAQSAAPLRTAAEGPTVIMVAGVNGSGKTTSIAKLTKYFSSQGKRVVLGAGDTFRAAAVEQLSEWARRLGAEIVTEPPAAIRPASPIGRFPARWSSRPMSASSTPPAVCKLSRT